MAKDDGCFIRFLGTGGGDFLCPVTADGGGYLGRAHELGGKNLRWAAQAFLSPDILIDFFDGRQLARFGVPAGAVHHLLTTHCHFDHLNPVAIHEFAVALPRRLNVYGTELVRDSLEFHAAYEWDGESGRFRARSEQATNVQWHLSRPERSFRAGEATITPVHANHSINKALSGVPFQPLEHTALNYVIQRGGRTLFYGLDSSYTLPGTLAFLRRFRFDIAVLDLTFADMQVDSATSGHLNFAMLRESVAEFREAGIVTDDTVIVGSHMSMCRVKPHDDLVEEATANGIVLAYDGMELAF